MTEKKSDQIDLDAALAALKDEAPLPPSDLVSRVLSDAVAVQAGLAPQHATPERRQGIWQELLRTLGGWPAMAGLATAAVAGVWLGAFPPGMLPEATNSFLNSGDDVYLVDVAPELGFDGLEEAL